MPVLPQARDVGSAAVGVPDNPTIKPGPLANVVKHIGDNLVEGLQFREQKDDEDGRIWAAKTLTEARGQFTKRVTDAHNSGEDLNGLVPKVTSELQTFLDQARKSAPNQRGVFHLDAASADFATDIQGAAYGAEARYKVTKRVEDTQGIINENRNQVFGNPGLFAKAYAETKTLVDGLSVPAEAKAQLQDQVRGLADSAVQGMIENGNPYEAAKQLKAGAWNSYLDADRLAARTNQAQAEIKRREAEARANAAQARAENYQDAIELAQSDLMSRQATGKGVDPAQQNVIRAGFTDKQWEKYQAAAAKADAVFKVTGDMRAMTPQEMTAVVDKAKPVAGAADYATQAEAHAEAAKLMNKVLTERTADPARAAAQAFPNVATAWEQQNANPEDPGHMRNAIKKTLAAQTAMGIPADKQKPIPAQMAAAIAGDIRSAPADQAAKKLAGWQEQFGANWAKVYGQMAPQLDAHTQVAATLSPNLSAILLETARTADKAGKAGSGIDDLRKSLGVTTSGDKSITDIIAADGDFQDFRAAMVRKGRGGSVAVSWSQGTEALALGLMARNGISMSEAADAAIKATVREKYNFGRVNGVPFVTPKTIDAGTAERGARTAQATLKADGLDLPAADPGAISKDTAGQYLSAVQRNGYWVTSTGNRGLELWAADAPVTRYGQRIALTWEQLEQRAAGAPAETSLYGEGKIGR